MADQTTETNQQQEQTEAEVLRQRQAEEAAKRAELLTVGYIMAQSTVLKSIEQKRNAYEVLFEGALPEKVSNAFDALAEKYSEVSLKEDENKDSLTPEKKDACIRASKEFFKDLSSVGDMAAKSLNEKQTAELVGEMQEIMDKIEKQNDMLFEMLHQAKENGGKEGKQFALSCQEATAMLSEKYDQAEKLLNTARSNEKALEEAKRSLLMIEQIYEQEVGQVSDAFEKVRAKIVQNNQTTVKNENRAFDGFESAVNDMYDFSFRDAEEGKDEKVNKDIDDILDRSASEIEKSVLELKAELADLQKGSTTVNKDTKKLENLIESIETHKEKADAMLENTGGFSNIKLAIGLYHQVKAEQEVLEAQAQASIARSEQAIANIKDYAENVKAINKEMAEMSKAQKGYDKALKEALKDIKNLSATKSADMYIKDDDLLATNDATILAINKKMFVASLRNFKIDLEDTLQKAQQLQEQQANIKDATPEKLSSKILSSIKIAGKPLLKTSVDQVQKVDQSKIDNIKAQIEKIDKMIDTVNEAYQQKQDQITAIQDAKEGIAELKQNFKASRAENIRTVFEMARGNGEPLLKAFTTAITEVKYNEREKMLAQRQELRNAIEGKDYNGEKQENEINTQSGHDRYPLHSKLKDFIDEKLIAMHNDAKAETLAYFKTVDVNIGKEPPKDEDRGQDDNNSQDTYDT